MFKLTPLIFNADNERCSSWHFTHRYKFLSFLRQFGLSIFSLLVLSRKNNHNISGFFFQKLGPKNASNVLTNSGGNISGTHPGKWEDRRVWDAAWVLALMDRRAGYTLYYRSKDTTHELSQEWMRLNEIQLVTITSNHRQIWCSD